MAESRPGLTADSTSHVNISDAGIEAMQLSVIALSLRESLSDKELSYSYEPLLLNHRGYERDLPSEWEGNHIPPANLNEPRPI